MTGKKKAALYALGMIALFSCGLTVFILAADEQSILSSGQPAPAGIHLRDFAARSPGQNKYIELDDFYFGKNFVYTTELTQFNEVYVPVFPGGTPETGSNLHLLVQIRNDRHSNQPLIQTTPELEQFVEQFNRNPSSISGVVRKPIGRVRSLTVEAYPGTDGQSVLVLWARDYPTSGSILPLWGLSALSLAGAVACGVAFRKQRRKSRGVQIELLVSALEAAAGKEARVTIPDTQEAITVRVPPGVANGTRMRFPGKGRSGKDAGDFYIVIRVK